MGENGKYVYDWPRPMMTADAVVFGSFENKVKLLLIRRKKEPFKGKWALPGGFVGIDEELEDGAARELSEETGLGNVKLEQMRTFGNVCRDPRGRVISIVYMGITTTGETEIKGGDDAAEARWFDMEKLPKDLAFDHNKIVKFGIKKLKTMI